MRRFLKILHTLGAVGFMGGIGALLVTIASIQAATGPIGYIAAVQAMAKIAAWIVGPSMLLTVLSGLLSIAAHPGFHDAGWVWAKAATGIAIFEGGLHILGPIQEEAKRVAAALTGGPPPDGVAALLAAETNTMWLLLAVSAANIVLGVWRPRFSRSETGTTSSSGPENPRSQTL